MTFRSLFGRLALLASPALLYACASAPDIGEVTTAYTNCPPNRTVTCTCANLEKGVQQCNENRELTPCVCGQDGESTARPMSSNSCGNGEVEAGEACDGTSGCSETCQPIGNPPQGAATCPGQTVHLWSGKTLTLKGSTEGYANNTAASCFASTGADRVYEVIPHASGTLKIDAQFAGTFSAVVELRKDACGDSAAQLACEDTLGRPFAREIPVEAGSKYYLVVDGDTPATAGFYTINLEL